MSVLNLTGQGQQAQQVEGRIQLLKSLLNQRQNIWRRLPAEKQREWMRNPDDPIMVLGWELYEYLDEYFEVAK